MALLYQVDFTSLATQAGLSAGAVTLDGLTWYLKGNLSQGGGLTFGASLENGSGLRLRVTGGTPAGVGSSGDLNEPHFFLPLAGVPQFSTGQALLVRGRFTRGANSQAPLLGLADSTNDAVGLRAAVRVKDHFCGIAFTSTTTASVSYKAGSAAVALGNGRTGSIANSACVPGIMSNHLVGWGVHGSENLASGIPTNQNSFLPAAGNPTAGATGDPHFQFTTRANAGVFFGVNSTSAFDSYLQWLRIDVIGELQDATAPVVTLVSPTEMTKLRRFDRLTFDVTGSTFHAISFIYPSLGIVETAIDSADTTLGTPYAWTRSSITGGYRYVVYRRSGWPAPPKLRVRATDGNIA